MPPPAPAPPLIPKPQFIPLTTSLPVQTSLLAPLQPASALNNSFISHPTQPPQPPLLINLSSMSTTNKGIGAMLGPGSNKVPSFNRETSELLEFFELFEELALSCVLTDEQKCKAIVRYTNTPTKRFWVTLIGFESKDYTVFKASILAKYPRADQAIDRRLELKEPTYTRNEAPDFEKVLEAGWFVLSDNVFDADLNEPIATRLKAIRDMRTPKSRPSRFTWDSDDEEE
ncbi:hypothetical protein BDR06DRAFT_974606 [Suillus hirtellus]|nr:hypothetical protein BDR06DRAFT_974606 [Suillus hirtellus]